MFPLFPLEMTIWLGQKVILIKGYSLSLRLSLINAHLR